MPEFSPAFWEWFKESKVVDAHGQPLVVYHGTQQSGIRVFKLTPSRDYFGPGVAPEYKRYGFYFASDRKWAADHARDEWAEAAPVVMSVYLSIKNPVDAREGWPREVAEALDDVVNFEWLTTLPPSNWWEAMDGELGKSIFFSLLDLGYDGILAMETGTTVFVAFDPHQIKSADQNDGTWDADDPDIRSNPMSVPVQDREVAENPSWVDKIVKQHCTALEAYAAQHGLPMPVLENCKPSKEFGCGHYGCVMATSDPGIVFKISSDETEAHFIGCYLKLRDKLPFDDVKYSGMVDYKAIVGLKESSRRTRRVYAIWREEAQNVGKWEKASSQYLRNKYSKFVPDYDVPNYDLPELQREGDYFNRQISAVDALMRTFQANAGQFRLKAKGTKDRAEYFQKVAEAINIMDNGHLDVLGDRGELKHEAPSWIKGTRRLAFHLETCRLATEMLESEYLGDRLGKTLGFFLNQGLLLADVHGGNLGTRGTDKEAIITDPGHLVILKPEWEHVDIEAI